VFLARASSSWAQRRIAPFAETVRREFPSDIGSPHLQQLARRRSRWEELGHLAIELQAQVNSAGFQWLGFSYYSKGWKTKQNQPGAAPGPSTKSSPTGSMTPCSPSKSARGSALGLCNIAFGSHNIRPSALENRLLAPRRQDAHTAATPRCSLMPWRPRTGSARGPEVVQNYGAALLSSRSLPALAIKLTFAALNMMPPASICRSTTPPHSPEPAKLRSQALLRSIDPATSRSELNSFRLFGSRFTSRKTRRPCPRHRPSTEPAAPFPTEIRWVDAKWPNSLPPNAHPT